jgi:WD40 repeat protein
LYAGEVIWDLVNRQPSTVPVTGSSSGISGGAFTPDGSKFIGSVADEMGIVNRLQVFATSARPETGLPAGAVDGAIEQVVERPDGTMTLLMNATPLDELGRLDPEAPTQFGLAVVDPGAPRVMSHLPIGVGDSAVISRDGLAVAVLPADQSGDEVAVFDASTGDLIRAVPVPSHPIEGAALAVDGSHLAIADDLEVRIVDIASGSTSATVLREGTGSVGLAFTADGDLVVVEALSDEEAWRLTNWTVDGTAQARPVDLDSEAEIEQAVLADDDVSLVVSSPDGTFLISLDEPALAIPLTRQAPWTDSIGLGHNSHALIQTTSGPQLWDLRAVQPVGAPLAQAAFALRGTGPDAELLRLAAAGGVLFVGRQSLDPGVLVDRVCQLAGRNLTAEEWRRFFPDQDRRDTCPDPGG